MKLKLICSVAAAALAACAMSACSQQEASQTEQGAQPGSQSAQLGDWGVELDQRDTSVEPGDDFNAYANGTWLKETEIPGDLARYGMFDQLRLDAEADIRAIVEELADKNSEQGSLEQKVGDFYASWMNVDRLDELGTVPLQSHLDAIYGIDTDEALMQAYASLHGDAPFGVGIIPDPADTTKYIAFVGQSGLGMPDRDYYLNEEDRFVEYREAYDDYVTSVFTLAGLDNPADRADAVIALETELASVHWSQQDSRDIQKIYNPMSQEQLSALAPEFDWPIILSEAGLSDVPTFVVAQTTAIDRAAEIFANTGLDTIKDYLAFHFINAQTQNLSTDFDDASFEFFGKTLQGTEEKRERWKRGVQQINAGLGEAVGQIYVERHFPPSYKAEMEQLVSNLTSALEVRLQENEWMDDETREQALLKLSTFEPRIGYTEIWTDYSPLEISKDSLLENALAITAFQWQEQLNRLGGPVDREIWPYPPQTVNASYNPLLNQITFPAGILQPPFFDPYADPAVNYGAIGAVIGHEIGHGFDDQGRRFDELGRIRDWWTDTANNRFQERADKLGAQYDSYEPIEGLNVNGTLTMGENIGDLGGLQMGYAAYHRYLDECCGGEAPVIDGLTGDQRFFLGWAQIWRAKMREDELRRRVLTDPHSPPQYRINGIVRNHDAWYEAFGVTEDDALYLPPEERVGIW
ncbi:M13 family metallopeptidase [Hyphococcus flavus]|uniref:M13 family metallopeptidase n=1 Tax=Hyphococcus flavus TaxID=1866326 RepID=A0AAF0CGJ4_9PROT|nr:M13 family metallopeptidase [Hyphococcus flavus]WDI30747.1 M13 family metallopeptidase [Hyphococcus flavus]